MRTSPAWTILEMKRGNLTMRRTKPAEAAIIGREHLVRVLLEHLERTYSTEGMPGAARMMEQLLLRLDETALREYAYQHGLTTEHDVEPETEERDRLPGS
jgi:hypothetical protein